jgi:hypothetical protein
MVLLFLVSKLYVLPKYVNGLVLLLWMENVDDLTIIVKNPSCWIYYGDYNCFASVVTTYGGSLTGF